MSLFVTNKTDIAQRFEIVLRHTLYSSIVQRFEIVLRHTNLT